MIAVLSIQPHIFSPPKIPAQSSSSSISEDDVLVSSQEKNINNDISINTYYNALDSCNILWNIIKDSLPSQWDFSICFPDCHAVGITSSQDVFIPNEQAYLNCHMYPNGQAGEGIIQMEITTNSLYKDTITWTGSVNSISFFDEFNLLNLKNQELIKIVDLLGRETKKLNQPLFYIYNNGKVDKRIVIN